MPEHERARRPEPDAVRRFYHRQPFLSRDLVRTYNFADLVIEHLQSKGVSAESATKGVPVVEKSAQVLLALLHQLEEEGGHSLLLVTSDFESVGKVVVECYTREGDLAWKKRATGGTGWTGRPYSAAGMNEKLVERILDKLDGQVGDPCLPVAD